MSTIAVAATATWTGGFTASTLPPSQAGGSTRTMAATDRAITDIAERFRQEIAQELSGIDKDALLHTTVTITVT